MRETAPRTEPVERGSALVVALLVTAILALLGLSFMLVAETETRIVDNERCAAQALYVAEAGARMVKRWFDGPGAPANVLNLRESAVDRSLRLIEDDGDPATAPHPQDGTAWPRYKQGIDLNADGVDDLLDRPYRGGAGRDEALRHALLGTESGPDLRIAEGHSAESTAFLADVSRALMADFPASASGVAARIVEIDVFGPPSLPAGGRWTRFGVATAKVTARICRTSGGVEEILAEHVVKVVLNEVPYPRLLAPFHSCGPAPAGGDLGVHWGAAVATGPFDLDASGLDGLPRSVPREAPSVAYVDLLHGWNSPADDDIWTRLRAALEAGADIDDPWFRFLGGGPAIGPAAEPSPQLRPPSTAGQDHSNVFQNLGGIGCLDLDYDTWKAIAVAGGENVHYFAWRGGTTFSESGVGPPGEFETLTNGRTGFFFFDTRDGSRPSATLDPSGLPVNVTPPLRLGAGGVRGFLYLNAAGFEAAGDAGIDATFTMPGEPFRDVNRNGVRDAGEPWINLNYTELGDPDAAIRGRAADDFGNAGHGAIYNAEGPAFGARTAVDGAVYVLGTFASRGPTRVYGSVIARSGVPGSGQAAGIYWNDELRTAFPPPSWDLPRVMVTRWETGSR
jgi:hypothetical protein